MPTLPWKTFIPPSPDEDYLVMASALPLKRYATTPRFFRYFMAIRKQLAGANGLVGYSLRAELLARRYWTLSVWEGEEELTAFMGSPPHVEIMRNLGPDMGKTKFIRWTVPGSEAAVSWPEALERLQRDGA
jgi:heme-degrading monooxygenase HmoA